MTADAIALVLAAPAGWDIECWESNAPSIPLTDILAADRLAQRERHAALARGYGSEIIAQATTNSD